MTSLWEPTTDWGRKRKAERESRSVEVEVVAPAAVDRARFVKLKLVEAEPVTMIRPRLALASGERGGAG